MDIQHTYQLTAIWEGNTGQGTKHIRSYERTHSILINGKENLKLTTDNKAVGNPNLHNPEDLLVAAVASCHLMSYLYVCALEGVVVEEYMDKVEGYMIEKTTGGGCFDKIILRPTVVVANSEMEKLAYSLHHKAHEICFIANSLNFPVICEPIIKSNFN